MNGNRPGDESLSLRERGVLERYVEPIMAALRACGAPPDTADQKPTKKGRRGRAHYSETVADLIAARLLKPETKLHPLKKELTETATVLPDGRLQVGAVSTRRSPARRKPSQARVLKQAGTSGALRRALVASFP